MKLAEALLERKSLKEQINTLKERALRDARVQEGDEPSEMPEELFMQLGILAARLEKLIVSINKTNNSAALPDSITVMEAIAKRDMLKMRYQAATDLANAATSERDTWRVTRSEVKSRPTIDIAKWRKKVDALAKEYRELDNKIQAANWTIDLSE